MFPRTKHSATYPSPWQWAQRYNVLQGPMMKIVTLVYKIQFPGPMQSRDGNTTHLCATSEWQSVTQEFGKYIKNTQCVLSVALLSVFITSVNFRFSKNVHSIYIFFMLILLHIVGIDWLDNINYCYLTSNKAVGLTYIILVQAYLNNIVWFLRHS